MSSNLKNFCWLVFLASLWGPSFLFIKIAIIYIEPITLTTFRLGLGSALLFAIVKFRKFKFPKFSSAWAHVAIASLFQSAIPFTMFAVGEQSIDSSLAAIICGASPLFTLIIAHFFTRDDRFTKSKLTGSIVGFAGLFILIAPALLGATATAFGVFSVLIGAVCYAIGFVYVKKFINLNKFPSLTAPTLQLFFSFLFLLPLAVIFENPVMSFKHASLPAILSALALAVFGSAIAFTVYYKIIKATSATYTSTVNYIVPVFGMILGIIILDETVDWNSYLGCALILFGVMIANGIIKFSKPLRQKVSLPL